MTRFSWKVQKPCFWAIFGQFCPMGIFSKKSGSVTHKCILAPNTMLRFRKKKTISHFRENLWTDGRTDGHTLFCRILPADAGGPTTSAFTPLNGTFWPKLWSYCNKKGHHRFFSLHTKSMSKMKVTYQLFSELLVIKMPWNLVDWEHFGP